MITKDIFQKIWRGEVVGPFVVIGLIAYFFISRYGLIQAYLKASGIIGVLLTLVFTIFASRQISRWLKLTSALGQLIQIPLFFAIGYSYIVGSHILLIALSGYPDYVLFPCSYPPQPGIEEQEAKTFWMLRPIDRFDCDS
ncbi:hypothetical protein C2759_03665 [Polynucleobacter sp. MG-Unter2-18]|uniref:hypothetical protein n=1 Tax=Polynucleobacter sp. MG-Unter2-18 TaxID=2081052 RepID=UPI001BFE80A3|nr:hypothetical protein [Polynucleobacter sp. MG-Unter2-18]QWD95236.1 hypothetical protein C2759_03665 [Polynucleobacter sp. MG-Unter2-18]